MKTEKPIEEQPAPDVNETLKNWQEFAEEQCTVTYGVDGYTEIRLQIPTGIAGMAPLNVHFTGGQITGYGTSPARYTTDDSLKRYLIEASPAFKGGRIRKLT